MSSDSKESYKLVSRYLSLPLTRQDLTQGHWPEGWLKWGLGEGCQSRAETRALLNMMHLANSKWHSSLLLRDRAHWETSGTSRCGTRPFTLVGPCAKPKLTQTRWFQKCLGPRQHCPKKGRPRSQVINLTLLKRIKAWGNGLLVLGDAGHYRLPPEPGHTRPDRDSLTRPTEMCLRQVA